MSVSCKATGTPPPNVTWTKDGNEDKILSSNSILSLKNISREQHGLYRCIADNGLNKAFASISIIVQCKCEHYLGYFKGIIVSTDFSRKSRGFANEARSLRNVQNALFLVTKQCIRYETIFFHFRSFKGSKMITF